MSFANSPLKPMLACAFPSASYLLSLAATTLRNHGTLWSLSYSSVQVAQPPPSLPSLIHVAVDPCLCNKLWVPLTTPLTVLTSVGWNTVANICKCWKPLS